MKLYACMGSGNCMKPWLLLHQLGRPFDLTLIDVLKGEQKSEAFLAKNPLGVVPFLETNEGRVIGESNAMLWYLAEGTPLMPTGAIDRAEALQWMFFEQSKLEPFISPARFFSFILPQEKEAKAQDIEGWQRAAEPGLRILDDHLSDRSFILNSGYSIADIALFGYVHVLGEAGLDWASYPNIADWVINVSNTDGFRPLSALGNEVSNAA